MNKLIKLMLLTGLAVGILISCGSKNTKAPGPNEVEVIARDFAFEAPDTIRSGWTAFRMKNEGEQHHFINLVLLPEGKTFGDYMKEVAPPFDKVLEVIESGEMNKTEATNMLLQELPEWIFPFGFSGGPGLTAPGRTAQATVNLKPGTYVMECYVRTPEGDFHSMKGMVRPLYVTGDTTDAAPPEADMEMTLANNEITVDSALSPGQHTFKVTFGEHPEGTFPNDVHLARLDDNSDLDEISSWMDWRTALKAPAPATFIGGIQNRPAGDTGYFTVDLEPGNYVWISEEHAGSGMLKTFSVE